MLINQSILIVSDLDVGKYVGERGSFEGGEGSVEEVKRVGKGGGREGGLVEVETATLEVLEIRMMGESRDRIREREDRRWRIGGIGGRVEGGGGGGGGGKGEKEGKEKEVREEMMR